MSRNITILIVILVIILIAFALLMFRRTYLAPVEPTSVVTVETVTPSPIPSVVSPSATASPTATVKPTATKTSTGSAKTVK